MQKNTKGTLEPVFGLYVLGYRRNITVQNGHKNINSVLVQVLVEVARSLGIKCHVRGTMLTIEGPRFSSRAESLMFRQWGADVINMTTVPEVVLAKEAGLSYASIAMATDYDCWKEHEEAVSGRLDVLPYFFIILMSLFVPCVIQN